MKLSSASKAAFWTLGCKLNQTETEGIAAAFHAAGFAVTRHDGQREEDAADPADIVIINSCTVTSRAEQKTRRLIRAFLNAPREPFIIVSGCYAELDRERLWTLDQRPAESRRLFVLGVTGKDSLLRLPAAINSADTGDLAALLRGCAVEDAGSRAARFAFMPERWFFHSRALLKIQDGCDNHCTYCRIRLARGPALSLDAASVLERLRALEDNGAAEVTLTGVNISQYQSGTLDLGGLLGALLEGTRRITLRLSSLEQAAFTPSFFTAFSNERVLPHLHFSVQSGSEPVLRRMGRKASPGALREAIAASRKLRDDPFIACDIIAGFPGESEADFEETLRFCREADFAWIHAFPFSPRPGTPAAAMTDKTAEREITRRTAELIKLAKIGKRRYIQRWLGRESSAVVEEVRSTGFTLATSANYLKVALPRGAARSGERVRCRIMEASAAEDITADVRGELC